jgi:hypothetical protein
MVSFSVTQWWGAHTSSTYSSWLRILTVRYDILHTSVDTVNVDVHITSLTYLRSRWCISSASHVRQHIISVHDAVSILSVVLKFLMTPSFFVALDTHTQQVAELLSYTTTSPYRRFFSKQFLRMPTAATLCCVCIQTCRLWSCGITR